MAAGRLHGCAEQVLGEDGELWWAQRHNSQQMPLLWVLSLPWCDNDPDLLVKIQQHPLPEWCAAFTACLGSY